MEEFENALTFRTRQLKTDDILTDVQYRDIAGLIYATDSFIFPALFSGASDTRIAAENVISYALKKGTDHMYCKENLFICYEGSELKGSKIVGMILWYAGRILWNYEDFIATAAEAGVELIHDNVAAINKTFFVDQSLDDLNRDVSCDKSDPESKSDTLTIVNLCINQSYRGRGVGGLMLSEYISLYNDHPMELCVLKNNLPAVKLYTSCGFKVVSEYPGFSESQDKPICYGMVRSVS